MALNISVYTTPNQVKNVGVINSINKLMSNNLLAKKLFGVFTE